MAKRKKDEEERISGNRAVIDRATEARRRREAGIENEREEQPVVSPRQTPSKPRTKETKRTGNSQFSGAFDDVRSYVPGNRKKPKETTSKRWARELDSENQRSEQMDMRRREQERARRKEQAEDLSPEKQREEQVRAMREAWRGKDPDASRKVTTDVTQTKVPATPLKASGTGPKPKDEPETTGEFFPSPSDTLADVATPKPEQPAAAPASQTSPDWAEAARQSAQGYQEEQDAIREGTRANHEAERTALKDELAQIEQNEGYIYDPEEANRVAARKREITARLGELDQELGTPTKGPVNVDWDGRKELIDEYNQLWWLAHDDLATPEQEARLDEVEQALAAGDAAVGNEEQFYNYGQRNEAVLRSGLSGTAGAIGNAAITTADALLEAGMMAGPGSQFQFRTPEEQAKAEEDAAKIHEFFGPAYEKVDALSEAAAADLERAKGGLSEFGKGAVDAVNSMIGMGVDAALAPLTGGSSLAAMFVRTYGAAAKEARDNGADIFEQMAYGLTDAGIEVFTEKLGDGLAGLYGPGVLDGVKDALMKELTDSTVGRALINMVSSAIAEGNEEVLSDLLHPFAERVYNDDAIKDLLENGYDEASLWYDFLIGAAIGSLGGTVETAKDSSGANIQEEASSSGPKRFRVKQAPGMEIGQEADGGEGKPFSPADTLAEAATPTTEGERKTSGEDRAEEEAPKEPKTPDELLAEASQPKTEEERKTSGEDRAEEKAPEAPKEKSEEEAPEAEESPEEGSPEPEETPVEEAPAEETQAGEASANDSVPEGEKRAEEQAPKANSEVDALKRQKRNLQNKRSRMNRAAEKNGTKDSQTHIDAVAALTSQIAELDGKIKSKKAAPVEALSEAAESIRAKDHGSIWSGTQESTTQASDELNNRQASRVKRPVENAALGGKDIKATNNQPTVKEKVERPSGTSVTFSDLNGLMNGNSGGKPIRVYNENFDWGHGTVIAATRDTFTVKFDDGKTRAFNRSELKDGAFKRLVPERNGGIDDETATLKRDFEEDPTNKSRFQSGQGTYSDYNINDRLKILQQFYPEENYYISGGEIVAERKGHRTSTGQSTQLGDTRTGSNHKRPKMRPVEALGFKGPSKSGGGVDTGSIKTGDSLMHKTWGNVTVTDVNGGTITVKLGDGSTKRIAASSVRDVFTGKADSKKKAQPSTAAEQKAEGAPAKRKISSFRGEYSFLSNFYDTPVGKYKNAEAAFQAAKCADPSDRAKFENLSGAEAKRLGRRVKMRPDWDSAKYGVMLDIVREKFKNNPTIAEKLLATGDAELVEGNTWGDTTWGVNSETGEGKNWLGKILMQVRDELRAGQAAPKNATKVNEQNEPEQNVAEDPGANKSWADSLLAQEPPPEVDNNPQQDAAVEAEIDSAREERDRKQRIAETKSFLGESSYDRLSGVLENFEKWMAKYSPETEGEALDENGNPVLDEDGEPVFTDLANTGNPAIYSVPKALAKNLRMVLEGDQSVQSLQKWYDSLKPADGENSASAENFFYDPTLASFLEVAANAERDAIMINNATQTPNRELKLKVADMTLEEAMEDLSRDMEVRLKLLTEIGVDERIALNKELRDAKTAEKPGGREDRKQRFKNFMREQMRVDTFLESLVGYSKANGKHMFKLADRTILSTIKNVNVRTSARQFFSDLYTNPETRKTWEAIESGKLKGNVEVPHIGHLSINYELSLLRTLYTQGGIDHIMRYGIKFLNEEDYNRGIHNNGKGEKAGYQPEITAQQLYNDALAELKAKKATNPRISLNKKSVYKQMENNLKWLRGELMRDIADVPVAKAAYDASVKAMEYLADELNPVAMRLYGLAKAVQGETYWPLRVTGRGNDLQFINNNALMLEDASFWQARKGSTGALFVTPFADTMSSYIDRASRLAAWGELNSDLLMMSKALGIESGGTNQDLRMSLQSSINQNAGKSAADWMTRWMELLNGQAKKPGEFGSRMRSNLAGASLSLNPGVALKQSPSYFNAAGIVDLDILAKNRLITMGAFRSARSYNRNAKIQEINKHTSALESRKGNTVVLGEQEGRVLFGNLKRHLPNWITARDVSTVSNLALACGEQVKRNHKDDANFDPKSDAYYKETAELLERAMVLTQPMYVAEFRPDYLRSSDSLTRAFAMFRTQHGQNINQMMKAYGELAAAKRDGVGVEAATKFRNQVVSGFVVSQMAFSLLSSAARLLSHKTKDYEDEEGNFDYGKLAKRFGLDLFESAAGVVWFGDTVAKFAIDVTSGALAKITGKKELKTEELFGITDNNVSVIDDILSSMIALARNPSPKTIKNAVFDLSQGSGLPTRNVYNMFNALFMYHKDARGLNPENYDDIISLMEERSKMTPAQRTKETVKEAISLFRKGDIDKGYAVLATLDNSDKNTVKNVKTAAGQAYVSGDIDEATYRRILASMKMTKSDIDKTVGGKSVDKTIAGLGRYDEDKYAALPDEIESARAKVGKGESKSAAAARLIVDAAMSKNGQDAFMAKYTTPSYQKAFNAASRVKGVGDVVDALVAIDKNGNDVFTQEELYRYAKSIGHDKLVRAIWEANGWKTSYDQYCKNQGKKKGK